MTMASLMQGVKDRLELFFLKSTPCSTNALGKRTRAELAQDFTNPETTRDWERDQPLIARLAMPEMSGGVNPGDQRALYYLLQALRPQRILEVGTHIGCSTVNMALAIKRLRAKTPPVQAHLLTVDLIDVNDEQRKPWLRWNSQRSPRQLVADVGCADCVDFRAADSVAFLRSTSEKFDLIFLDGLHAAKRVYQEVPLALPRLNAGGFLVLHDYFPDLQPLWSDGAVVTGPYLAVRRLKKEGAKLDVLPFGALPWPTKLGSHHTSLALVSAL